MKLIGVDSDQVLHDMDLHFKNHHPTNADIKDVKDEELWNIVEAVPDFFLNMPMLQDAHALVDGLVDRGFSPFVLTGAPRRIYELSREHKIQKFARNFPGLEVLVCPSKYKPLKAAVHLGMVDQSVMDLAEDLFLNKFEGEQLIEVTATIKYVMSKINLNGLILLDDMSHNCIRFLKANGRAIRHKTAAQTLDDLDNERFFQLKKK